jgi:hypothetical protein
MAVKLVIRRDTAANWALANPILADGEIAHDETAGVLKVGDGVTAWNALPNVLAGSPGLVGPTASGDTTGATDTAAINILLSLGYVVTLPAGHYYINAPLKLAGNNGLSMAPSDATVLEWVGAAGGSVLSTAAFTSPSQAAFWGVVEGGEIHYPYAKITSSTKVVYIAQPNPSRTLTTTIRTDYTDVSTHAPVAGSAGWVLDGNSNPGPFSISSKIIGQFDKQIWARTSHLVAIGCQGAYGNDLIVFDNDALGSSTAPMNCSVIEPHTFLNQRSAVRLIAALHVNILSGVYESATSTSPGGFLYCDSTFTGSAMMQNINQFTTNPRIVHYGTGSVRFLNVQDGWDATFVGNSSTGVASIVLSKPQQIVTSPRTNYGTVSTTTPTVGVTLSQAIASSVGGAFRVRFVGQAFNNTAGDGYNVQLLQSAPTSVGAQVSGSPGVLDSVSVASVRAAGAGETVTLEALLTGQNTPSTSFVVAVTAVGGGVASVQGIITVEIL